MMGDVCVVVTGAAGRMGSRVVTMTHETAGMRLVGACEMPGSSSIGEDLGLSGGLERLDVPIEDDLAKAIDAATKRISGDCSGGDAEGEGEREESVLVVVDFTSAPVSVRHAEVCAEKGVAMVTGTTGFDESQKKAVEAAAGKVPIVMAPNMSVGVNLMLGLAKKAAEALGEDYDVEILEAHHRMKADAPSGTALRLGEVVSEALGRNLDESGVYERRGTIGARTDSEIGMQTLRGGDVVGEHTVYFFGDGDRVELTHRATNRDIFVRGAVRAAGWVADRPAGLYGMEDVLQLK